MEPSTQLLLTAISTGSREAFNVFFHLYYVKIMTFVKAIVKDDELAEETVQEIFIRVWQQRDKLCDLSFADSYLRRLARNVTLNMLKKELRGRVIREEDYKEQGTLTTDEELEYRELLGIVMKRLEKMPPQRRRVFIMSRFQGKSNKEIASALNISVKTVENHISAALRQLGDLKYTIAIILTFIN